MGWVQVLHYAPTSFCSNQIYLMCEVMDNLHSQSCSSINSGEVDGPIRRKFGCFVFFSYELIYRWCAMIMIHDPFCFSPKAGFVQNPILPHHTWGQICPLALINLSFVKFRYTNREYGHQDGKLLIMVCCHGNFVRILWGGSCMINILHG